MSSRKFSIAKVSSLELKCLLHLLMYPDYRAPIDQIRPSAKTQAKERERLCDGLRQKGLLDFEETTARFGLTAAGRTVLGLDASVLPITPDERLVLQSCQAGAITPGQIYPKVPENQRQRLIMVLAQRGLLKVFQSQIETVWITAAGKAFLREDCLPQGHTPVLSWTLMSSYLTFIRNSWSVHGHAGGEPSLETEPKKDPENLTSDQILAVIMDLDAAFNTENYLPIYYLRDRLQPPLTRKALDQQLYQLQRDDRIDLSTLQDVSQYRKQEVLAGIPQDIGGPLFFISVL